MNNQLSLSESMQQTLEVSNLEFVGDFGEIAIDSIINEAFLRDVPLIGTLVGAGKCIKNLYDAHFAKKLIAFLIPLKDTTPEERPEAMDKGVFTIGSITSEAVCQAVELATTMHANGDDACPVPAYTDDNVSTKVIKLIQSYVGIINKMVWRK